MAHMMAPPALPAAPTGMVLNVEVPPLTIENAHGPSRFQAIAEFKARNLTVPVQLNDTIGHVYTQIEARYKRNYCNPKQTAAFAINKLQNADGFDLDVDDTVGSIFGCETDPKRRKIIVVHSFFDRDFSVPVDSNLRPAAARKRLLELRAEHANKRRRIQASSPPRDQPIPTTESEPSQENTPNHAANGVPAANRSSRAHTGDSMVYMEEGQTGKDEFPPVVKSESPELGLFPRQHTPESLSVEPVAALSPIFVREETQPQVEVSRPRETIRVSDSAMLHSPEVTPAQGRQARSRTSLKRKDIYDVPSSPDFVTKKPKPKMATYGRSPKIVEKEVDLLNSSRWESAQARKRPAAERLNKAHAFYFPDDDDDEIESTPQHEEALNRSHSLQNGVSIPYKGAPGKISKPGSLKKPSSSVMSNIKAAKQFAPSSSRQSIATPEKSTTSKISDPTVRARFAALREGRKALQVLDNSTENNDTGPATPAGRLTVNEEAVFAEPTVVARLSAQPSVPKTPVPLPANVGNLSQKEACPKTTNFGT
ncbi:hypothetical protein T440DRAFT_522974 [Plenodomus tracheiphilus IPT5]|uniref:Nucleolar protein Dnt1-like N-terminal domain-containing protein n=1 Tax=Plenodomus tracheiphilus IPT5 TaxID=1408161 RepID=A0A6A7ASD2_9PLEO|nr:hypothetical protein T440DRAFT_522974 [Plenodomus tracheiphilus IPT5]